MLRFLCFVSAFLPLAGCATTLPEADAVRDRGVTPRNVPSIDTSLTTPREPRGKPPAPTATRDFETPVVESSVLATPVTGEDFESRFPELYTAQAEKGLRENRFTIKGGYYSSSEDGLDDGLIVNAAWTRFFNNWMAGEFEIGYLDADGSEGGVSTDLWGVPIMLNGRANIPIWILDVYGGLGIGTIYYDVEATAGPISASSSGWVWAGNAFLGATLNVADRIALGLEGKYYLTDDIEDSDDGIDAWAIMLTLGFSL